MKAKRWGPARWAFFLLAVVAVWAVVHAAFLVLAAVNGAGGVTHR